jgi:RNA polymerase-binding transcription factor DksA
MLIPSEILIGGYKVATLLIFASLSLLYWVFIVWYEGRKDGFESDKVLDLAAASIVVGSLSFYFYSLFYKHTAIYNPGSPVLKLDYGLTGGLLAFIGSLIPLLILSNKWSWSKYRLLDIYAMAYSLFMFLFGLGRFVVYLDIKFLGLSALILPFYLLILRYRGYKFPSGVMFSFFTVFLAIFGIAAFRRKANLPVYVILFTLSVVNLFFRNRRSMYKRNLPAEFINALKSKLQAKDKNLKDSQQLLVKEDPYLQQGRDTGNSEEMDEAILEDYQKSINDAEMGIVKRLRIQVKKALAAIKIGRYGVCEICGKPIDKARLKAYPEATTCIDCASKKKPGPEDE